LDIPTDDTQAFQRANLALTLNPKNSLQSILKRGAFLFELASKNPKATDEEIKQALLAQGIKYEPSKKETAWFEPQGVCGNNSKSQSDNYTHCHHLQ